MPLQDDLPVLLYELIDGVLHDLYLASEEVSEHPVPDAISVHVDATRGPSVVLITVPLQARWKTDTESSFTSNACAES